MRKSGCLALVNYLQDHHGLSEADAIKQAEHILGVEITPSPDVGTADIDSK